MITKTPLEIIFPELQGRIYKNNTEVKDMVDTEDSCYAKILSIKDKTLSFDVETNSDTIEENIHKVKQELIHDLITDGLPTKLFDLSEIIIDSSLYTEGFRLDKNMLALTRLYLSLSPSLKNLPISPTFLTDKGYIVPTVAQLAELQKRMNKAKEDYLVVLGQWLEFIQDFDVRLRGFKELYQELYCTSELTTFKMRVPRTLYPL